MRLILRIERAGGGERRFLPGITMRLTKKAMVFFVWIQLKLVFFLVTCVHHIGQNWTGILMIEIWKPGKGLALVGYTLAPA